jgi:putative ABC transport system permease protein
MTLVIRSAGRSLPIESEIRNLVASLNGNIPVSSVRSMDHIVAESIASPASTTWLFVTFSILALALGMIGIYSLISYSVAGRTHEVGVRMALGARRKDLLMLIVKQGMALTLTGIVLGLAAAVALTRFLASLLYEVPSTDAAIFIIVPVLLLIVALSAIYIPARRATKVDPMAALRFE